VQKRHAASGGPPSFQGTRFLSGGRLSCSKDKDRRAGRVLRGDLGFANARPHRVHQIIESLGPNCFVTTNYDSLIETQFALSGRHLKQVTNRQVADFADIVRADAKDFVFKIHGSIDHAQSIVLSEAQYHQTILNSTGMRSVFETVKIIMATRPVVFLGYGLRDMDLVLVLRFLQQTFDHSAGRYWAIMPDLDEEEVDRLWETYRIRSISYQTPDHGHDHSAFLQLLERIRGTTIPLTPAGPSDPATTLLSLARYGSRISKLDPGPGVEVDAFLEEDTSEASNPALVPFRKAPLERILQVSSSLILQGPAGSGKSFAVRRYLGIKGEELREWALSDPTPSSKPVLPILLDARLYNGSFVELAAITGIPSSLDSSCSDVQAVIVVDSVDEMPSEHLDKGVWGTDLHTFADRFANRRIIFGTRRADLVPLKGLPIFHILPLGDEVLDEVFLDIGLVPLSISSHLRYTLSSPFMLELAKRFISRDFKSRNPGPLFEAFLQFAIDAIGSHATTTQILSALQELAWNAMECGRDTISTDSVESLLVKAAQRGGSSSGRYVDRLVACGFLVSEIDGHVRFVHRAILEYLAAREFANRFSANELTLANILLSRRWDNALAWSVAFLTKSKLSQLVSRICKHDRILALRMADLAEVGRDVLLNAVLRELIEHPPDLFEIELRAHPGSLDSRRGVCGSKPP
jgi:SIR2-like domain